MTDKRGTKSYQKSFQTKLRRRREGKTDYQQRTRLIKQDVNKPGAVKSRLVVRITNSRVICSIQKSFLTGDRVIAYADSNELKRYGVEFGKCNYFAAYATGLLVGRKALMNFGLDKIYQPNTEVGEDYNFEKSVSNGEEAERKPYKVFLDIGLSRSSKGSKVFGAMKGASDAGLFIPHGNSKLPGYDGSDLDASILRDGIFCKANTEWMAKLKEESPELYKKQFSQYIKLGIQPENIEELYKNCLSKIIENPIKPKTEHAKDYSSFKKFKVQKITNAERKAKVAAKLEAAGEE